MQKVLKIVEIFLRISSQRGSYDQGFERENTTSVLQEEIRKVEDIIHCFSQEETRERESNFLITFCQKGNCLHKRKGQRKDSRKDIWNGQITDTFAKFKIC